MSATAGYIRYGIGTICLFIATFTGMMTAPAAVLAIFQSEAAPGITVMLVAVAAFFAVLGVVSWVRAIRVTPGEHLLDDQRGLLIGLMIGTVVLLAGFVIYSAVQVDFWRGAIEGMRDGASD